MKKFLVTIMIVLAFGFSASAQYGYTDAFVKNWDDNDSRLSIGEGYTFVLPGTHGGITDANTTPLGSGLLILGALGAGYAVAKRRR